MIQNADDPTTGSINIDGLAIQGETLTADTSEINDLDGLGSFSYQWIADGSEIDGATGSSFELTQKQVGEFITVKVSHSDKAGFDKVELDTPESQAVGNINDEPTGDVSLEGYLITGQTLNLSDTLNDLDNDDNGEIDNKIYGWQRSKNGQNWIEISTANEISYQLSPEDAGHLIRASVSYTDDQRRREENSRSPHPESSANSVKVNKLPIYLKGSNSIFNGRKELKQIIPLNHCQGENSPSLITSKEWGGQEIRVRVNGEDKESLTIQGIDSGVGTLPPLSFDGALETGVTLNAGIPLDDPDGVDLNAAETDLKYTWQRYSSSTNSWNDMADSNAPSYATSGDDQDQPLRVKITYNDVQGFANTVYSNSLTPRESAPTIPKVRLTPQLAKMISLRPKNTATIMG